VAGPDVRKSLEVLQGEWAGCTRCQLSEHRILVGGNIVFGEGRPRGILFLGEGPGVTEEAHGRPFIGKSGALLRKFIEHYSIRNYYITNVVACRSCAPVLEADGSPRMTRGFRGRPPEIMQQDQPPLKPQVDACAPRVYEEIYMADPVVIVALGQPAASFLKGSAVKIKQERGIAREVQIPGAGARAALSDKRQEWVRRVKGEVVMPMEQSQVRYLMIPTFHPSFVLRQKYDDGKGNPFECFADDLRLAKILYNRYYEELSGMVPDDYEEGALTEGTPYKILDDIEAEES
jgi:DNA polymerase